MKQVYRLIRNHIYFKLGILNLREVQIDQDLSHEIIDGYVRRLKKYEAEIYKCFPPKDSNKAKTTVYAVYWFWSDTRIRIFFNSLNIQYVGGAKGDCHGLVLSDRCDPEKAGYVGFLSMRGDSRPSDVASEVIARQFRIRGIGEID